jgi:hypothetical protein
MVSGSAAVDRSRGACAAIESWITLGSSSHSGHRDSTLKICVADGTAFCRRRVLPSKDHRRELSESR